MKKRTQKRIVARQEPRRHVCGIVGPYSRQAPVLERVSRVDPNGWSQKTEWRIWTDYNPDRTAGTFLSLEPNGSVLAITVSPTGEITNTATVLP